MGKKRRSNNPADRDASDITSDSELVRTFIKQNTFKPAPALHLSPPTFNLKTYEDRRAFHPEKNRPPAALPKRHARLVIPPAKTKTARATLPSTLQFSGPKAVVLCVRRKQRREVLFAKRKTRKGHNATKRRNEWSDVKC